MKMTDDVLCVDSQWCGDWPYDVDMVREEEEEEKSVSRELTKRTKGYLTKFKCREDQSSVHMHPRLSSYNLYYILFCYLVFIYPSCDVHVNCAPVTKQFSSDFYLLNFGYLPQSGFEIRDRVSESTMTSAIEDLQRFGHINVTGVMDEDTLRLMRKPRCGVPDRLTGQFNSRHRAKRFTVQGQKWDVTEITWSLKKDSAAVGIRREEVLNELRRAFKIWSDSSDILSFRELHYYDAEQAHIQIVFEKGPHNDGYPFDGQGSILAHAFFPGSGQGGDVHFDDDEKWQVRSSSESRGTRLFTVAAHEFGHSLGLSHSDVEGSLMYPWYQTFGDDFRLPTDDKRGIEAIYGWKRHSKDRTSTHRPTVVPERRTPATRYPATKYPTPDYKPKPDRPKTCDTSYDAVSLIRQELFIFKGPYFWRFPRIGSENNGSDTTYPSKIVSLWPGLPHDLTHIDAVYERGKHVFFFIGKHYWKFEGNTVLERRQPLTKMKISDTIDKIDGAMVWGHNDKTYLFSGSQYWRLNDDPDRRNPHAYEVEPDYPRDMYVWKGVPYNIDSVLKWTDNHVYFFKGKVFWKFDDRRMQVASETPSLSAPFWMGCTSEPIPRHHPNTGSTSTSSSSQTVLQSSVLYSCILFLVGALRLYFYSVDDYC